MKIRMNGLGEFLVTPEDEAELFALKTLWKDGVPADKFTVIYELDYKVINQIIKFNKKRGDHK